MTTRLEKQLRVSVLIVDLSKRHPKIANELLSLLADIIGSFTKEILHLQEELELARMGHEQNTSKPLGS